MVAINGFLKKKVMLLFWSKFCWARSRVGGWVVSTLPPPSSEGPEQSAVDWSEGGSVFITTTTNRDSSHNYLHTAAPWGEIIPIFIPLGFHGIFLKFCKRSDKYSKSYLYYCFPLARNHNVHNFK